MNPGSASGPSRLGALRGARRQASSGGERRKISVPPAGRSEKHRGVRGGEGDEQRHQQRPDDEDQLDEHRFEGVGCREQVLIAQLLPEIRAHAYGDRRKRRAGKRRPHQYDPGRGGGTHRHDQQDERGGEGERAQQQGAARTAPVDEAPQCGRHGGQPDDITGSCGPTARERVGGCLHQQQNGEPGNADWQAADHRGGNG